MRKTTQDRVEALTITLLGAAFLVVLFAEHYAFLGGVM